MLVHSIAYDVESKSWSASLPTVDSARTLVLAFGAPEIRANAECFAHLAKAYPRSIVIGCSSSGEIHGTEIRDKSLSVTMTKFDKTDLVLTSMKVTGPGDSFATGQALAKKLMAKPGLRGVLVLSEGLNVNGSELVRGLNSSLDESIVVSGGLSGDGTAFKQTWVAVGAKVESNVVAAVGFYGDFVQIGHGSKGGWDKFGPERIVTKSEGNVLFELDGKPALALYKEYLGDKAKELPGSGLLFPLALRATSKDDKFVVRTLLAVDHEKNSLTFAGDIPKGYCAQLMKADFDRLIGGASLASTMAKENGTPIGKDSLVVAISCVGRRLVLGERTEEEVEAVLEALPKEQKAHITGFYSYGEISPYASGHCDLHNQTMTLTVFSESPTPIARTKDGEQATAKDISEAAKRAAVVQDVIAELEGDADSKLDSAWTAPRAALNTGFRVDDFAYDLATSAWSVTTFPDTDSPRTLVTAFGAPEVLGNPDCFATLAKAYPKAILVGCSSAGEIHGTTIKDQSLSVTVTRFDKTDIVLASMDVSGPNDSFTTGQALAKKLATKPGLRGVLVLSEGLNVNGSELVRGLNSTLDDSVVVTGGLSGDGTRFKQTWVAIGSRVKSNMVAAVGFYGDHVQIGHGSKGGWDKFGPERVVTKSEGNVLYELDGKPALQLYKEYLGDKAKELPASGLLFPLSLRSSNKDDKFLVRTLLAVDHEKNTLTFAGDIPQGYQAQLMKADFDRLIGGASLASAMAKDNGTPIGKDSLVIAISCVGRRLVLGERTEEEVEAVLEALPKTQHAHITGFYSYGEISPYATGHCDLHNQTMTLTVFSESPTPIARKAGAAKVATPVVQNTAVTRPPPPLAPAPAASAAPAANTTTGFEVADWSYDLEKRTWSRPLSSALDSARTLVVAFGASEVLANPECFAQLARTFPRSIVVGCSSAGEIHGTTIKDKSVSVTVSKFQKTDLTFASMEVDGPNDSFTTGQALAKKLAAKPGLRGVLILSEGLNVNGSELVRGLNSTLDESVVVTGGLSGDGTRFKQTWVAIGSKVKSNVVAAVGFYGDYIQIGHGSKGGWDKFGPERVVTKAEGNVLYELDGKPALQLYKEYLGDKAKELPASGLLFPLSLRATNKDDKFLVRTLLAVDHEKNTLTFAGDIPKGYQAQLMKADFDRLIGGASLASAMAKDNGTPIGKDALVIAISCVGRRLVLGERTEEEVEAVLEALPKTQQAHITGFYSYGEISPYASGHCDLHNQTMTLTVFSESPTPIARKAGATKKPAIPAVNAPKIEELDLDIDTGTTSTRRLAAMAEGFNVASFSYDLDKKGWSISALPELDSERTLVLGFGSPDVLGNAECFAELQQKYPRSIVVGCSSAGEIHGTAIRDRSVSVTVSRFAKTDLQLASIDVSGPNDSFSTGQQLARKLSTKAGLRGVLILSEGLNVNGSELVRGINSALDESVVVTGGLSGDGTRFKQTWVAIGGRVKSNQVVAVGFYGDFIQIGHGSKGGWDKFGPERIVTKAEGNVLFELDGKPALQLYKEYLGEKAKELPASGLLFPLSLRSSNKDDKFLVRTLLAVDHEKNTLTFAGDIPKGYLAQLMKADFDRLIGGASLASAMAKDNGTPIGDDALVVAISCVGRRLVLGERTEEEVEAVLAALPKTQHAHITGFYSYGEISPYATGHCDLHNQTMTLTVFSESATPLPKKIVKTSGAHPPARVPSTTTMQAQARPATQTDPLIQSPPSSGGSGTTPSLLVPAQPLGTPTPPNPIASPTPAAPRVTASTPGGAVTRTMLQASGATGANVQKQQHGNIMLLTITGRLTESFKGEALGRELRGNVVVDLGGVERITSFGVREWLAMIGAMQDVRRFYLLRCSEAVVNQLSMIRKFAGNGQIVSFFAPYLCGGCNEQFERSFDCEREAEAIRSGRPEPAPCPHCGAEGNFDDDARSYFAFAAPHLNSAVPGDVRAILDELDAAPPPPVRDAVDKTVEGNVTRVRVQTKLNGSVRWKRVLDGIEGALVIDLGGVTGVEPAGITNFEQALMAIGDEVTTIGIERAPSQIVDRFATKGVPRRVTVTSATLDAFCKSCAVHRPAVVSINEHGEALNTGAHPRVPCKRCNAELQLQHADAALHFLKSQMAPAQVTSSPNIPAINAPAISDRTSAPISMPNMSLGGMAVGASPDTARGSTSIAPPAPIPAPKKSWGMTIAIGALAIAVGGLGVMQYTKGGANANGPTNASASHGTNATPDNANHANNGAPADKAATPAVGTAWAQNVDLPPAWVERPFVIEGNDVFVVGKSEAAATSEVAIGKARNDAIVRLVKQIHQDLNGTATHDFVQARTREGDNSATEAIANRYLKQNGSTATPERVDAALRKKDSGVEGFARYKIAKSTYQAVVASYRETTNVQGMTIARFFPLLETTLHTDGDLVVIGVQKGRPAADQGVRIGDIVLAVGSKPGTTPDAFGKAATDEWTGTAPRASMSVEVESAGAKRTVRFFKPAPTAPQGNAPKGEPTPSQ